MANETWKCSCGAENTGKYCGVCGKPKDDQTSATAANDVMQQAMQMQLQMKQRELQMEEKHRQSMQEHDKALKEYNDEVAAIPRRALKKWGSSWIVLVLAILVSVSALFTLISTLTSFKKGAFKIISGLVSLLIAALICAGFWKAWVSCRKKDDSECDPSGVKMLRGVLIYKKVITMMIMSMVMILVITVFALLKSAADYGTGGAGAVTGEDYSGINMSITTILIVGLVVAILAFVVLVVYYQSISKFANQALKSFKDNCAPTQKFMLAAIFFFIIGGFSLISTITTIATASTAGAIFDSIFSEVPQLGSVAGSLGSLVKIDWFATISNFVNAATFVFAGLLVLRFNKLGEEITTEVNAVPTPSYN